jgi:Pyruvate/2-oxoacid:ferredoxin oxidoreductase delta subunit
VSDSDKYTPEQIAEKLDYYQATTIPVHIDIDVQHTVVDLSEAEAILRAATSIALGDCACRTKDNKCGRPVNVCLAVNQSAEELKKEFPSFQHVSVERGLEALRISHEAGLVHLAFRKKGGEITEFCSCCECCCWFLGELKQFDYHDGVVESARVAQHLPDDCVACGLCVAKCPFDAWQAGENGHKPTLRTEKCFGCGVCVTACPAHAIAFETRQTVP